MTQENDLTWFQRVLYSVRQKLCKAGFHDMEVATFVLMEQCTRCGKLRYTY